MLSILPSVYAAERCPNDVVSGPVEGENFVREGKDCPCSYVSPNYRQTFTPSSKKLITVPSISNLQAEAECTVIDESDAYSSVRGRDCSLLEVNGTLAAEMGEYPKIEVRYDWKICNFNEADSKVELTKPSYFKLWRQGDAADLFYKVIDNTTVLTASECESHRRKTTLDTSVAKHFMSAQMQGPTAVQGEFCYAYAFNPITVKYDTPCDMSVSTFAAKYQVHNDPF